MCVDVHEHRPVPARRRREAEYRKCGCFGGGGGGESGDFVCWAGVFDGGCGGVEEVGALDLIETDVGLVEFG